MGGFVDAPVADLFKLEDDIVAHLSRALQIELVQAEGRRSVAEMRRNPDATDLAMQGWSIMYRTPAMKAIRMPVGCSSARR